MKMYSGQAIAIIMVVLVVATVIGASLYSRMIKNRGSLVESKESTRAMEQVDTLLDLIITSDLAQTQLNFDSCLSSGSCTFNSLSEYSDLFGESLDSGISSKISDWCENTPTSPNSDMLITVEYADIGDYKDYNVGEVMALKLGGLGLPSGCNMTLGFKSVGTGEELFTVKRVYMDASGNIKPYEEDDMLLYCFSTTGSCDAPVAPKDSIVLPYFLASNTPENNTIQINMTETKVLDGVTYTLYEIRVLPLYGKLGISTQADSCASTSLYNYKVTADVTCDNIRRAGEVVIPNVKNLGYNAMFDYTIYNSTGVLQPN